MLAQMILQGPVGWLRLAGRAFAFLGGVAS
jgi:hypothetical protein